VTVSELVLCAADAVRIITAGGVYINGRRVTETEQLMSSDEHILPNNLTLLRTGQLVFGFVASNKRTVCY